MFCFRCFITGMTLNKSSAVSCVVNGTRVAADNYTRSANTTDCVSASSVTSLPPVDSVVEYWE